MEQSSGNKIEKTSQKTSTFDYIRFAILIILFVFALWFIFWTSQNYQSNFVDTLEEVEDQTEEGNDQENTESEQSVIELDGIEDIPL